MTLLALSADSRVAALNRRFEQAVQASLVALLLALVAGSASVVRIAEVGRTLRWILLGMFAVVAVVYAMTQQRRLAPPALTAGATIALVTVAAASALWSVEPRLTVLRTGALALVVLAAAAVGAGTGGSADAAARLLVSLFVGVSLIASLGALLLAVSYDDAVIPGAGGQPPRYRGVGGNPNTVPLLAALALPVGVWLLFAVRSLGRWLLVLAMLAVLLLTAAFADSRGALLAGFVATVVVASRLPRTAARRAAAVALLTLAFVASAGLARLPQPPQHPASVPVGPASAEADPAPTCLQLPEDLLGLPPCGGRVPIERRPLVGDSGRFEAWQLAFRQATERPLLGYGFGTERDVFVDRSYEFVGSLPENSYLGLALQVGFVGVGLFLLLIVAVAVSAWRAGGADSRDVATACSGVVAAGVVLGVSQSYFYAAGNVAAAPFWIALLLLLTMRSHGEAVRPQPVNR